MKDHAWHSHSMGQLQAHEIHMHMPQVMLERARLAASAKSSAPTAATPPSASDPLMAKYKQYKRQAAVVAMAGEL
jgi:hypothetical protein